MSSIGEKILDARRSKGLTQEDLAELSKMNLRTIQRIENNECLPRGKTLLSIYQALGIKNDDFKDILGQEENKTTESMILKIIFLVVVNVILMLIIGYLTLDSNANFNSRIGAYLLSFFIPLFIIYRTPDFTGMERLLKYGSGLILYLIIALIFVGPTDGIKTGLIPCIIIASCILYLGDALLKNKV